MRAPAAHQVTTRHLGAAYPFVAGGESGPGGAVIGRDVAGTVFAYDPFVLYRRGVLTNPNMVIFGQIGRGKSALVKTYLWRQSVFGRRAWVLDPKGEYAPLAAHWGIEPLCLRPGGTLRLNPLDAPADPAGGSAEVARRRGELLCALASAGLGRALLPTERVAVELAVDTASARSRVPTLPDVVAAMLAPTPAAAAAVRTDADGLAADGRQSALELRRLVTGDLRGMFDGHTSPGIDLSASLVVLDLSALYRSGALGVVMTCATAWLHAQLAAGAPGPQGAGGHDAAATGTVLVVDEAWAILADLAVARWLQASWKLARAWGVANVAVLHRVSDLGAAAPAGSEHRQLAQGLLADSETRVVYAQAAGELAEARRLLGLSTTEADLVPHLGRGVGLWKVGDRSLVVRHLMSPAERPMVGTDSRMDVQ